MRSALVRRIAPAVLAVGVGVGVAGATANAASPSAETATVAPATYGSCTTTTQSSGGGPTFGGENQGFFFTFFTTSFSCSGPNGVAQRNDVAFFQGGTILGSSVTLNNRYVQTSDFSDAFVRRLAGLAG